MIPEVAPLSTRLPAPSLRNVPCLLAALLLTWAPNAHADAELPPIDDDGTPARLRPEPGSLDKVLVEEKKAEPEPEEPEPTPGEASFTVSAYARVGAIPDFILDAIFDSHPGYVGASAGLTFEYGDPRDEQFVVELDWTQLQFPNYVWLETGVPAAAATYAELDLHMISVDLSYRGMVHLVGDLYFHGTAGLGIGGLVGKARTAEVLPTCTDERLPNCPHWRKVTVGEPDLPFDVLPILHLSMGLSYEFGVGQARLIMGFRGMFYVGAGIGFHL